MQKDAASDFVRRVDRLRGAADPVLSRPNRHGRHEEMDVDRYNRLVRRDAIVDEEVDA